MDEVGGGPTAAAWLVTANVVAWRRCGVGGQELRAGTKSFRGGAKVYVVRVYWGPGGDRLSVLGRERHSSRWINIDMATRHLHGFRPKLVHTPRVLERLGEAGRVREAGAEPPAYVTDCATTLERYARRYRAEVRGPHPDRCLCHSCLTGESVADLLGT
ncbi:hypothetical protein ACFWIN_08655 [Streptomyces sp. NPDC127049]|uniref:hypothetical protein n=1 Tax=unclassified Streptomyces TaxID=2593676 RepID=UPI003666890D